MKQGIPPGKLSREPLQKNMFFSNVVVRKDCFWPPDKLFITLACSWSFWPKNDTERIWNHLKKPVLDLKREKLNQKSGFWHLVSVSWGWGTRWPGPGGTQMGRNKSQPSRNCVRTLWRHLKLSLVREKNKLGHSSCVQVDHPSAIYSSIAMVMCWYCTDVSASWMQEA